jgi:hemerythrin superfamily protein
MDVTKMLEADHRMAEDLIAKIKKAEGEARQPLVDELATALQAHMELEEKTLYSTMEPVTGEEEVTEANNEHELARKALQDVIAMAPDEPGFGAALDALEGGLQHHIKDEEDEVFPELRKDSSYLEKVATPFMQTRAQLGMDMPADALAASFSKDELVEEATQAGIDGAEGMNKDELAKALSDAMKAA